MHRRILLAAVLAALAAVGWAEAVDKNKPKTKAKPAAGVEIKNVGPTIPSKVVATKVAKLTDQIDWYAALDEAQSQARRENKAVLWLHVLGDLDQEC